MRFEFPQDFGLAVPILLALLSLRLLRLAARTRRLPELLVGVYFLLVPWAVALNVRFDRFEPSATWIARAAACLFFTCGGASLLLFAWSVFRPDAGWARGLALGGSALVFAIWALGFPLGLYDSDLSLFLMTPVYTAYLWVFLESLRTYWMMRKRARLGLADPVVVNRFLLFAIWTASIGTITLVSVVGSLIQLAQGTFFHGGGLGSPVILLITRLLAVPIAVSIFLTFLAPARYHAWLRARAASGSGY